MPLVAVNWNLAGLAVSEEHQGRQVHGARRAAVDEQDAFVADDLHPVVVGIVDRIHHHLGCVGEIEHAVASRRLELEQDGRRRIYFGDLEDEALDARMHVSRYQCVRLRT